SYSTRIAFALFGIAACLVDNCRQLGIVPEDVAIVRRDKRWRGQSNDLLQDLICGDNDSVGVDGEKTFDHTVKDISRELACSDVCTITVVQIAQPASDFEYGCRSHHKTEHYD